MSKRLTLTEGEMVTIHQWMMTAVEDFEEGEDDPEEFGMVLTIARKMELEGAWVGEPHVDARYREKIDRVIRLSLAMDPPGHTAIVS